MRFLDLAAITREDCTIEDSNAAYGYGSIKGDKASSDSEDLKTK